MSRVSWAVRRCFHSGMTDQRPHVVQPVGQLDDEHPPVVGHGHQHLAHRGRLLGLLGVELETVELGDTVHDERHRRSEVPFDDLGGHPRVLDGVVEEGGGHGLRVETQVGDDAGHGHRMGDVRPRRTVGAVRHGPRWPSRRPGR